MTKQGTVRIAGKEYAVTNDGNGNQTINGMSIDDFIDSLDNAAKLELVLLGQQVVQGKGKSPQAIMDGLHQIGKVN